MLILSILIFSKFEHSIRIIQASELRINLSRKYSLQDRTQSPSQCLLSEYHRVTHSCKVDTFSKMNFFVKLNNFSRLAIHSMYIQVVMCAKLRNSLHSLSTNRVTTNKQASLIFFFPLDNLFSVVVRVCVADVRIMENFATKNLTQICVQSNERIL